MQLLIIKCAIFWSATVHAIHLRSSDKNAAVRGPKMLVFFDTKFEDMYDVFQACARRAMGNNTYNKRVSAINVDARKKPRHKLLQSSSSSLLQPMQELSKSSHQALLPTRRIVDVFFKEVRAALDQGHDVMHIDTDVYLFQDPLLYFDERYAGFDIVASPDCAFNNALSVENSCNWYKNDAYEWFTNRVDVLERRGFMMNTGLILFRNKPEVRQILSWAQGLSSEEPTIVEQTSINLALEVLFECRWTKPNGDPAPTSQSLDWLAHQGEIHGACYSRESGHENVPVLRVAQLDYGVVDRGDGGQLWRSASRPSRVVGYHPGAGTKEKGVEHAKANCFKK